MWLVILTEPNVGRLSGVIKHDKDRSSLKMEASVQEHQDSIGDFLVGGLVFFHLPYMGNNHPN